MTSTIDTSGFDAAIDALMKATGLPMREVTRAESRAVLQMSLDRTKLTAARDIRDGVIKKHNRFAGGRSGAGADGNFPKISIAPKRGRVWWVENGPKFYVMDGAGADRRWSNARWSEYQTLESERRASLKSMTVELLARRGLPKQSWYFLGLGEGHSLKAAGVVTSAAVNKQALKRVASSSVKETDREYTVIFTNRSIATIRKDGSRVLASALQGRIKFFKKNLSLGVFQSLEKVERAYPGLVRVNPL